MMPKLHSTNFEGMELIRPLYLIREDDIKAWRDYNHLQEIGIPMPRMLDVDTKAERIVKEYIAGETVYTLVLKDALPETCLRQVQAMCRLLYPAHTNIDYFPTNFILQGDTLYYIDYECNDYMDEWNFENWGCKYWAKTPEFLQYAAEHP